MDILQLLKEDLHGLLNEAQSFVKVTTKKKVLDDYPVFDEKVRAMVATEQRFLFPEIEELFSDGDVVVDASRRHKDIVKHLDKLRKLVASKKFEVVELKPLLMALAKTLELHSAGAENVILPRMRREISTSDREDLAMVYADAKLEWGSFEPIMKKAKAPMSHARA